VKYIFIEKQKVVLFPLIENQREIVASKSTSSNVLFVIIFPMFRKNFKKATNPTYIRFSTFNQLSRVVIEFSYV
jgi:hypothetical protein